MDDVFQLSSLNNRVIVMSDGAIQFLAEKVESGSFSGIIVNSKKDPESKRWKRGDKLTKHLISSSSTSGLFFSSLRFMSFKAGLEFFQSLIRFPSKIVSRVVLLAAKDS